MKYLKLTMACRLSGNHILRNHSHFLMTKCSQFQLLNLSKCKSRLHSVGEWDTCKIHFMGSGCHYCSGNLAYSHKHSLLLPQRFLSKHAFASFYPLWVSKQHTNRSSSSVVKMSSSLLLHQRFLASLPDGIQMAFAYGSGVFQQEGHADMTKNMLDFVIVVDDVESWHRKNLALNWKHYSALKLLGSKAIASIQEKYGAGIYFNTLVNFEDRLLKYGVISTRCLITDLLDWNSLYISGRLHKPVKLIVQPDSKSVTSAMHMNLQSAVHAALLQLPESFSEEALYTTIAGLSYGGDFRMTFGEDHNKVVNLVRPNIENFRHLYEKILDSTEHLYWHRGQGRLEQPQSHVACFHHLQLLPKTVLLSLQEQHKQAYRNPDLEEVLRFYAHDTHCDEAVARCIGKIVRKSSWSQSLKTILSAGIRKSFVYSAKKMGKMVQGKQKPKENISYRQ